MSGPTDYLVVGAGASGLAFADALVAEADVEVTLIERRPAPGGHWLDAYPFVRLHTPSAYYGVNSLALGEDRIDEAGENAGYYERATGEEVCGHFAEAAGRLGRSGRVRVLTGHEHAGRGSGGEQVRDLNTGAVHEIAVRRKVVDARYLEASVPATHTRPFEVSPGARVVPVSELPAAAGSTSSYTVLGRRQDGGGRVHLAAGQRRGAGPRSAGSDRATPGSTIAATSSRWSRSAGSWKGSPSTPRPAPRRRTSTTCSSGWRPRGGSSASTLPSRPTMYRGTMLSAGELHAVRQIEDVVRLGHVRRIEADRIVLERGEVETGPDVLHVDCTALGLRDAPGVPIFQPGRIVLQQVRHLSPSFNAALLGFVEAHREDDADKNRLCPPNPYPSSIEDWPRMMSRTWTTEQRWLSEPDVSSWIAQSRLNLLRALPEHVAEPAVQTALQRYLTHVGAAIERLHAARRIRPASAAGRERLGRGHDQRGDLVRGLQVGQVRAAGQAAVGGVRKRVGQLGAAPDLDRDVELAAGDDRRDRDLVHAARGVESAGAVGVGLAVGDHDAVHVEGQLARRTAHASLRPGRPVEPQPDLEPVAFLHARRPSRRRRSRSASPSVAAM